MLTLVCYDASVCWYDAPAFLASSAAQLYFISSLPWQYIFANLISTHRRSLHSPVALPASACCRLISHSCLPAHPSVCLPSSLRVVTQTLISPHFFPGTPAVKSCFKHVTRSGEKVSAKHPKVRFNFILTLVMGGSIVKQHIECDGCPPASKHNRSQ